MPDQEYLDELARREERNQLNAQLSGDRYAGAATALAAAARPSTATPTRAPLPAATATQMLPGQAGYVSPEAGFYTGRGQWAGDPYGGQWKAETLPSGSNAPTMPVQTMYSAAPAVRALARASRPTSPTSTAQTLAQYQQAMKPSYQVPNIDLMGLLNAYQQASQQANTSLSGDAASILARYRNAASQPFSFDIKNDPLYTERRAALSQESDKAAGLMIDRMAASNVLKSSQTESGARKLAESLVNKLQFEVTPQVWQARADERAANLGAIGNEFGMGMDIANLDASQRATNLGALSNQFGMGMNIAHLGQSEQARLAAQALQAYGMDVEQQQFAQQFAYNTQRDAVGDYLKQQELQYGRQRDSTSDLWKMAELTGKIPEGLPGAGSSTLQLAAQKLSAARLAQERNREAYLRQKDLTQGQADLATQGYLSQILQRDDPQNAFDYIVDNADDIVNDGVDIAKLLSIFKTRYPEFYRNNQLDAILQGLGNQ